MFLMISKKFIRITQQVVISNKGRSEGITAPLHRFLKGTKNVNITLIKKAGGGSEKAVIWPFVLDVFHDIMVSNKGENS